MRTIRIFITLIINLILLHSPFLAPEVQASNSFVKIGAVEGLSSEQCVFTLQDSDGYLWIGTEQEVVRYDGYECVNLSKLCGSYAANQKFRDAVEDKNGNLWFATREGLLFYNKQENKIELTSLRQRMNNYLIDDNINSITCDNNNTLWLGGQTGVISYSIPKDEMVIHYELKDDNGFTVVLDTHCDAKNTIWVSTWSKGLYRYHRKKKSFVQIIKPIYDKTTNKKVHFYKLQDISNHRLCVGTWGSGLYIFDIRSNRRVNLVNEFNSKDKSPIVNNIVHAIEEDADGNIWLGTAEGGNIISNSQTETATIEKIDYHSGETRIDESGNGIRSIYRDMSNTIWVSTVGNGVFKSNQIPSKFEHIIAPSRRRVKGFNTVRSISEDKYANIVLGVSHDFLDIYNPISKTTTHYFEHPEYSFLKDGGFNTANYILFNTPNDLWIGTRYNGIVRCNMKEQTYIEYNNVNRRGKFMSGNVKSMFKDKTGNIWVATDSGLYRFHTSTPDEDGNINCSNIQSSKPEHKAILKGEISDVLLDSNSHLWVATYSHGVFRSKTAVCNEKVVDFDHMDPNHEEFNLNSSMVNKIYEDTEGKIWIATGGDGVKIWSAKAQAFVSATNNRLCDNQIFKSILEDEEGRIWTTSNRGMVCFSPTKDSYYKSEYYYKEDGLMSNLFSTGALFKSSRNYLIAGGNRGCSQFDPSFIQPDAYKPSVVLTSIKVNEEIISKQNLFTTELNHEQNDLTFSFSSLDLRNSNKNQYAYRLIGLEKDWRYVNAKNKTANYSNLPPGTYVFQAKGTNYMGVWSNSIAEVEFTITQAFYKTYYAYLFYFLLFVGSMWLYYYIQMDRLNTKNRLEIERLKHQKAEGINQFKLQFFMNLSHELLTPLSVLKIISNEWDTLGHNPKINLENMISRNVDQLTDQIKKILQFRKLESGNMRLSIKELNLTQNIEGIISNYKLIAANKGIQFQTQIPSQLNIFIDIEKVEIILNNLLSNAFKYNTKKGSVTLSVSIIEEPVFSVEFTVIDTGLGIPKEQIDTIFERYYRVDQHSELNEGLGIGLALVKNLVEIQGGSVKVESQYGYGTSFKVVIPACKTYYRHKEPSAIESVFEHDKVTPYVNSNSTKIETQLSKTVLVIDDNTDLIHLLSGMLSPYYKVLVALNGEHGQEIAKAHEIDTIVSDNMMGKLSGIDLCKMLKNDVNTSHIPFILITADHRENTKLLGYEAGVDSILTKPLNSDLLLIRIDSLLRRRQQVEKAFNCSDIFEPAALKITTLDEKFLQDAKAVVERNIENQEFSVKVLQKELSLSHSKLYRKIKGILGITPNEYIRNIRLRRAAQLLQADEGLAISDVAYLVGFNDLSYFGVCFKKQFDQTPRDYQKNMTL